MTKKWQMLLFIDRNAVNNETYTQIQIKNFDIILKHIKREGMTVKTLETTKNNLWKQCKVEEHEK